MSELQITDQEIEVAEKDILETGHSFNDAQKAFIKRLDSCYIQAYAGTGKTKAIVGKLHVLAQKETWDNGRGICVLSHTNVAVDEIKKHVAKHYPAIMQYPNFVGTIQEFVNQYLFIPLLAKRELNIKYQDDAYEYKHDYGQLNRLKQENQKAIKQAIMIFKGRDRFARLYFANNEPCFDGESFPLSSVNKNRKQTKIPETNMPEINQYFIEIIKERQKNGRFLFVESFIEGLEYLRKYPLLADIIRQRFQFVFLDEAQDCSGLQLELLNRLFEGHSNTMFQQIGDINQSITEGAWTYGDHPQFLGKSMRFGQNITDYINRLKVETGFTIEGNSNTTKKYLIIYDKAKSTEVLAKYAEIIKDENIPIKDDSGCFAVSKEHKHLIKYFSDYSEAIAKSRNQKVFHKIEEDIGYLDLLTEEAIRENGSNYVSRILSSLLYKHIRGDGRSRGELKELLRGAKADKYRGIVRELLNDILLQKHISDINKLQNDLNGLIDKTTIDFTRRNSLGVVISTPVKIPDNTFISSCGIKIKIGTIHSVKGQTHDATLMFSDKSYGEQDIQHVINGTPIRALEYKRLLYVASTRPKYLFVFAIEKGAYEGLTDNSYFDSFNKIIM